MKVVIAAGGTGGHLLPGLAVAKELKARGHRVHFVVRTDATSQPMLAKEGFASSSFMFRGFPRRLSLEVWTYPFLALAAFLSARRILLRERPDIVLGMGGYITVPVGYMAARLGIPLVLHEQNSVAGLANRFLSRRARAVALSFTRTYGLPAGAPTVITGLPLRPDLQPKYLHEARRTLGLDLAPLTVLVFGGSQGAHGINQRVAAVLPRLGKQIPWQFIHLTGPVDRDAVEKAYKDAGYRAFVQPFWTDMATLYSAADFVIARSGANTVMELARMGKPALLVPYPHATDNHQEANARHLEELGLGKIVLEKDLTEEKLLSVLTRLPDAASLRDDHRERVESNTLMVADAAPRLADLVEKNSGRF